MVDYSFIRLEPTFDKAKYTRNSPVATIVRNDFIQLLPNEVYLQTTSLKDGIAFDGNYQILVVDCTDAQLADVTNSVAIEQFTDSNGIPQIRFELANLNVDFYKREVYLKFIHTVSNAVWWSNPIIITSYQAKTTTRFDYLKYGDTYYNSIRLACYFDVNDAESSSSEYNSINGTKVTSRLIKTEFEKYKFERIDNFTYRRLNEMLSQTVVYVNGYRMTDKVVSTSTERSGDSNYFNLDFKVAMNYREDFTPQLQIFEPLTFTTSPIDDGTYSVLFYPFTIDFNRNITITDSTCKAYLYENGVLVDTVTPTTTNNILELAFTHTLITAEYFIYLDGDKITSSIGEGWSGISNSTDWNFTIAGAEFESTEFSNEFLV